jgi:tRNA nucleotidyltransferase/poly(A) polymerase
MPSRQLRVLSHHPAVRALIAAVAGAPCHLVGGALRDRLLGLPTHDLDAVVAGRGQEIAERMAAALSARLVLLGGKEFAAYRLVGSDFVLDLWDRDGTSLHDDLARRDLTINSFAWEPASGSITDPFGGLVDLQRRVLRATTRASFTGDPLRVLRVARLALQLPGFAVGPATMALARRSGADVAAVAAERVRDELARILAHPEAHRGIALLAALDLYPGLWLGHPGEPASGNAAAGAVRALETLLGCCLELRRMDAATADAADLAAARTALLFAALPGGPLAAPARLERFRDAGYLTHRAAEDAAHLLRLEDLPPEEILRRRFLHALGTLWPTAVLYLGARTAARGEMNAWRAALPPLVELALREGQAILDPPRLVTGEEIQQMLGISPGPQVGRALAAIKKAQVEGRVRTREDAATLLAQLGADT